jgi:hypothetical protein
MSLYKKLGFLESDLDTLTCRVDLLKDCCLTIIKIGIILIVLVSLNTALLVCEFLKREPSGSNFITATNSALLGKPSTLENAEIEKSSAHILEIIRPVRVFFVGSPGVPTSETSTLTFTSFRSWGSGFWPRRRGGAPFQGSDLGKRFTTWKTLRRRIVIFCDYSGLPEYVSNVRFHDLRQTTARKGVHTQAGNGGKEDFSSLTAPPSWWVAPLVEGRQWSERTVRTYPGSGIRHNLMMTPPPTGFLVVEPQTSAGPGIGALPSSVEVQKLNPSKRKEEIVDVVV